MTADSATRDTGHERTLPSAGPSAVGGHAEDIAVSTGMPARTDPRARAAATLRAAPDAPARVHRPAVVLGFLVLCLFTLLVLGLGLAMA